MRPSPHFNVTNFALHNKRLFYFFETPVQNKINTNLPFPANEIFTGQFMLPNQQTSIQVIDGICTPEQQYITLAWGDGNENSITFNFKASSYQGKYQLTFLEINFNVNEHFPNAAGKYERMEYSPAELK
jgi:hypothetical protein